MKIKHIIILVLTLLPFSVFAHGYWIEVQGSHKTNEPVTVRLIFGEYITGERLSGNFLDRMKEIRMYVRTSGKEEPIAMKQFKDYWEGTFTPSQEGSYEIIGINDEREVQDWTKHNLGIVRPVQYLKTVYRVGNANSKQGSSSFLDITVSSTEKGTYHIQVFRNNSSYQSDKLVIVHPDGEETTLKTDKDGKAVFTAKTSGMYLIDVEWIDKTPGQFKQRPYESVRHKLDFSLYN